MTPLAFRSLARTISNSPLSGVHYVSLVLSGEVIEGVRAPRHRMEKIVERNNVEMYDADHFTVIREDVIRKSYAGKICKGDLFIEADGTEWEMRNPVNNGCGEWKVLLIRPQ